MFVVGRNSDVNWQASAVASCTPCPSPLPAVGFQALIHRLAKTDLTAQLAYKDQVRAFHKQLQQFFTCIF
jgi:hypothetical protein